MLFKPPYNYKLTHCCLQLKFIDDNSLPFASLDNILSTYGREGQNNRIGDAQAFFGARHIRVCRCSWVRADRSHRCRRVGNALERDPVCASPLLVLLLLLSHFPSLLQELGNVVLGADQTDGRLVATIVCGRAALLVLLVAEPGRRMAELGNTRSHFVGEQLIVLLDVTFASIHFVHVDTFELFVRVAHLALPPHALVVGERLLA